MKIKKTVGKMNAAGEKNYLILTECGKTFEAERAGRNWTCNGQHFTTINDVKEAIESGAVLGVLESETTTTCSTARTMGTFDCCCPAALLIRRIAQVGKGMTKEERQTLDCYGYIMPDGKIDVEAAKRAIVSFSNRQKNFQESPKVN